MSEWTKLCEEFSELSLKMDEIDYELEEVDCRVTCSECPVKALCDEWGNVSDRRMNIFDKMKKMYRG